MNVSSLSSLTASATAAKAADAAQELSPAERARAIHLRGSALRNAAPAAQRAAVAGQFEAILVRQLLGKTITSMMGQGGGASASVYGDLLTDTFAQQLSAGQGMGLSRMIERQLTPRQPVAPTTEGAA